MKNQQLLLLILTIALFSTPTFAQKIINGSGSNTTQTFQLDNIHSIGLGIAAFVYVTQSNQQSVTIEGQANIIQQINQDVVDGSWNIDFDANINNYNKLKIYISIKDLKSLAIGGSGSIILESPFKNMDELAVAIGGNGKIELKGDAKDLSINIGGNGTVKASELTVDNCAVSIAGNGQCNIDVNNKLDVSIAGMGNVSYTGSPSVSQSIAGFGKVRRLK